MIPSVALILGILAEERLCRLYFIEEHPILGLIPIIGCFYFIFMGKKAENVGQSAENTAEVSKNTAEVAKNRKMRLIFLMIGMMSMFLAIWRLDWSVGINAAPDGEPGRLAGRVVGIEKLDDRTEVVLDRVLIRFYAEKGDLITWDYLGKGVELVVELEKPKSAGNPGNFDYRRYLYGRGIEALGTFKGGEIKIVDDRVSWRYGITAWIIRGREAFLNSFFSDEESRDLAGGILFGMGRNISDEVRDAYMEGGAGHILAVSGLHIGILYSLCKAIEKKSRIQSAAIRRGIIIILFILYGTASLWSVSVTRAILLVVIKEISDALDYRFDHLSALALISDGMLVLRPYLIFSNGFQMSFLAILGICFMRPKISFVIKKFFDRRLSEEEGSKELESALSTMLAVQLLMIPYTIYVYHRFSALAIINNWFMIALAGVYVPLGAGSFLFSMVAGSMLPGAGFAERYVGASLSYLGKIMTEINEAFLLDGKSVISAVSPPAYIVIGLMALAFYLASESFKIERRRNRKCATIKAIKIVIASVLSSILLFFNPLFLADQVFLDVGQGDSLHLSWEGANILVDGGGNSNYNVGEGTLKPYLLHSGVRELDLAISTHEHLDHFQGIEELDQVYPISQIITYGKAGDRIVFDDEHYIDILWPIPGYENSEDENYFSRIFKIYDRGITTLVTGDITEEGEKALIAYYGPEVLKSHILKVAHHGSRFSTCQEFIDAVSPIIAVISVGKNNYGHPAPSTIEKLERSGIIVYRTDRDGAVGIIMGKNRFWVCGNRRNMRIEEYNGT